MDQNSLRMSQANAQIMAINRASIMGGYQRASIRVSTNSSRVHMVTMSITVSMEVFTVPRAE